MQTAHWLEDRVPNADVLSGELLVARLAFGLSAHGAQKLREPRPRPWPPSEKST
jgi:hypothetical protein